MKRSGDPFVFFVDVSIPFTDEGPLGGAKIIIWFFISKEFCMRNMHHHD